MPHKTKQPRLLPRTTLKPIDNDDTLSFKALSTRYRCRCGNTLETGIRLEAVQCVRCGSAMKPTD